MRQYGVERRLVTTAELLRIGPAYRTFAPHLVGDTENDERGARLLYGHDIGGLRKATGAIN
jgi:D-amino-acid dehydrogenase